MFIDEFLFECVKPIIFNSADPQQTCEIGPTLVYCWANVVDGGPTVNQRWADVSCLVGHMLSQASMSTVHRPRCDRLPRLPRPNYSLAHNRAPHRHSQSRARIKRICDGNYSSLQYSQQREIMMCFYITCLKVGMIIQLQID